MSAESAAPDQRPVTDTDIKRLLARLYSGNSQVRHHAIDTLARSGAAGMNAVARLLSDNYDCSDQTRAYAATALAELGPPAIPALSAALKQPIARILAAEALAQVGPPSIPALVRALEDDAGPTRDAAASALLNIGTPESLQPLQQFL